MTAGTGTTGRASTSPDDAAPTWHARSPEEVEVALATSMTAGLDDDEVGRRLASGGRKELPAAEGRSIAALLADQFRSPLIAILVVAAIVTVIIEEYADAAVIAAVLIINAVIGFVQEYRADRAVTSLMELAAPRSTVVRGGRTREVDAAELVPGDVVLLTSGTRVPADLRLVRTEALEVDESLLTGESLPARKRPDVVDGAALTGDRTCMAFMGTVVASGRGRGLVTATGSGTQLGAIAESIRDEAEPQTPLQRRLRRFANLIGVVVLASTAVAFALGVALGEPATTMFRTAVALAVAVVPEGLPVAFTVAMALGVRRMARRRAIVRSLPAVETLGSTDVIGSDKTGTLTQNRMTVLRAWTADGTVVFGGAAMHDPVTVAGTTADAGDDPAVRTAAEVVAEAADGSFAAALRTAVLSNEADLVVHDAAIVEHVGDPTESALLEAAFVAGLPPEDVRATAPLLATVPFEPDRQYAYVVVDEHGPVLRCKGAPERVLERCAGVRAAGGVAPLVAEEVLAAADALARRGLRVLATAERRLDVDAGAIDPDAPPAAEELLLTGLVGMQDPPRDGVREAVARCRQAGVRVVMVTGDHAATARAIAADVGIGGATPAGRARPVDGALGAGDAPAAEMTPAVEVVTGQELAVMDDDTLAARVGDVDVFARVTPEHKLRVVRALRSHGHVVAVTGDGVNDGPALKAADIGVAMGRSGTDVAREASDMVLTDDDFVSIADAVEEGRVVFDNLRKVTYFLLSTGVAAIVAIITSIALGLPLPYAPAALLWLNLVTNGVQDVALAFEPGEPDVLDRPPRPRAEGLVTRVLWVRTVLTGVTMAAGSLWVFTWARGIAAEPDAARGAALTALVVAMAAHVYNVRSERRSILRSGLRGNPFLLVATAVALVVHLAATYWGPTQRLLQIAPVPGAGWPRIVLVAVLVILVSEAHKRWRLVRATTS
ncbi:cation-translocating P-type ATPase [Egicoccus sp. AB-alg2]|uniref:cation-translocating P-type ATPase n=1 Tax=Egicoccus sp. AB-alg2 TaxID=3242693 RepID=UPI00359CCD62